MIVKHKLSINLRCQNEGFLNIVKCINKCVKKIWLAKKIDDNLVAEMTKLSN